MLKLTSADSSSLAHLVSNVPQLMTLIWLMWVLFLMWPYEVLEVSGSTLDQYFSSAAEKSNFIGLHVRALNKVHILKAFFAVCIRSRNGLQSSGRWIWWLLAGRLAYTMAGRMSQTQRKFSWWCLPMLESLVHWSVDTNVPGQPALPSQSLILVCWLRLENVTCLNRLWSVDACWQALCTCIIVIIIIPTLWVFTQFMWWMQSSPSSLRPFN